MESPLISICIPAYNADKYIEETLDSVIKQAYRNWELIIVEDATKSNTEAIVGEYMRKVTQRVVYIRNEKTKGPSGTRNAAVALSSGEWIAFLDCDDVWHKDHLNELIKTSIQHPTCELIHSGVNVFESNSRKVIYNRSLTQEVVNRFPLSLFDRSYGFQTSQVMITRRLFDLMGGFNEKLKYGEDFELWIRCAKANFKFALSKKHTCFYRKHLGALTSNYMEMAVSMAKVYDIHSDWTVVPKSTRYKMVSDAWLAAARIARNKNRNLAKDCISNSIKYRYSFKILFYSLLMKIPF